MNAPSDTLGSRVRETVVALRQVPLILRMAWASGKALIVTALALRFVIGLVPLSVLAVAREIVGVLASGAARPDASTRLLLLVAIEAGLAALGATLTHVIEHVDEALAERYTRHANLRVMAHAATLDLATYEDPQFNDELERARVQASDRVTLVFQIARFFQLVITGAGLVGGIFVFAPVVIVLLVGCTIPALVVEGMCALRGYALNRRLTPLRRELEYLRTLGASKESAKELKVFALKDFLLGQFEKLADRAYREKVGLSARLLPARTLAGTLLVAGSYAGYALVVYRTWTGALTMGTFVFLTGAITGAARVGRELFSTLALISDQALYIRDLARFFSTTPKITGPRTPKPIPRPMRIGFQFEDVGFRYPGRDGEVLRGLTFAIAPGEKIALVGENGAGKTTIIKLLLRLYDPTSGHILLDGVDLREYDPDELLAEVGVIFQDFIRYEMSVTDNIAVGRISKRSDPEAIAAAAEKSLAAPFLRRLPGGYEQRLGRRFDGGVDLSVGEWQRVALARAYIRETQLIVLDEPTAALDPRAEAEVFQRFNELAEGRTTILISHRFSTVRMAQRILVLERGTIIEQGTHTSLIDDSGRYASMFKLQASGYR
jgi:ATP-binding cassette subfamily B protein